MPLEAELKTAGEQAAKSIDDFVTWFEKERLPRADGPFMVGTANLEARYKAEELIDAPVATLLRSESASWPRRRRPSRPPRPGWTRRASPWRSGPTC